MCLFLTPPFSGDHSFLAALFFFYANRKPVWIVSMTKSLRNRTLCGEHEVTKRFLQKLKLIITLHQCVIRYSDTLMVLDSLDVISGKNLTKHQFSTMTTEISLLRKKAKHSVEYLTPAFYKIVLPCDCSCCEELRGCWVGLGRSVLHMNRHSSMYSTWPATYGSKHKNSWFCRWWLADNLQV